MAKILVVEDDRILRELLKAYLYDHLVDMSETGEMAVAQLKINAYDLVILDWMLPDLTGIEVCQKYRANGGHAPIMMLTSRKDKFDKATALDAGADDYLVKPFEQVEFDARVRALLRRPGAWGGSAQKIRIRDLEIDTLKQTVVRDNQPIELRPREYALLEFLMRHQGQSFTAEALFARLWSSEATTQQDTVRVHFMSLRKKIRDSNENPLIISMRGRGYKISES